MPDVLWEIVPEVGAEVRKNAKAMGFAVEAFEFEHADEERREREGM